MRTKSLGVTHAAFSIKAAGEDDGLGEGVFTGYAAVFGNVDSYGDIVEPGAFTDTLTEWKASGDPIPLLWGHDMHNPYHNLGSVDPATAKEDDTGLLVEGTIDLTNPAGEQVYKMLKGRRVTDMSFAYTVHEERKSADGNHLLKLGLIEVSVVPIGANPATDILAVKAALADVNLKAGRVLSAANEATLRDATRQLMDGINTIETVLASVAVDGATTIVAAAGGTPGTGPTADGKASGRHEDKSPPNEEPRAHAPGQVGPGDEDQKAGPSVDLAAATLTYYSRLYGGQEGA